MLTRTKIICTIGPSCSSYENIMRLIEAGMNVARLNFSHSNQDVHRETIATLKKAREDTGEPLAIMLDTKGPEVRVGRISGGSILLEKGQSLWLVGSDMEGTNERISINPASVLNSLEHGMRILFDDGYVAAHVVERTAEGVLIQIENTGKLATGKSVNIPNANLDLPAMTESDISDIRFGCQEGVDFIAASFIRSADHVLAIKRLLAEQGCADIRVLAKIENGEGVNNFDSIVQVADGIVIARGDLGVELPLSEVPRLQKMMIRKCYLAGKPSVTATQMLESMIHNPRPTRAEASDVANAIYDSTSAVMLSGETAAGKYPIETVQVMKSIIQAAESDFSYEDFFGHHQKLDYNDVPSAVTLATVKTAYSSRARAIFAFTNSGQTARLLSRLRPEIPIVALTPIIRNYHQLAFNWGVIPVFTEKCDTLEEAHEITSQFALDHDLVRYGDLVVITAGNPFGISGTTNMMLVENIGDVLVRGHKGFGRQIFGKVCLVFSPDDKKPHELKDHILVITKCDDTYLPLLKQAAGVILQNLLDDQESEQYLTLVSKTLDIPTVLRGDGACTVLDNGQLVTLDPTKALVYSGVHLEEPVTT